MTPKAYLRQATRSEARIEALMARREKCRALAAARGGQSEALAALEGELSAEIDGYAALVRKIEALLAALPDPVQREALRYRYLNGWSWQVISGKLGVSQDWLWHIHARALVRVGELMLNED